MFDEIQDIQISVVAFRNAASLTSSTATSFPSLYSSPQAPPLAYSRDNHLYMSAHDMIAHASKLLAFVGPHLSCCLESTRSSSPCHPLFLLFAVAPAFHLNVTRRSAWQTSRFPNH